MESIPMKLIKKKEKEKKESNGREDDNCGDKSL